MTIYYNNLSINKNKNKNQDKLIVFHTSVCDKYTHLLHEVPHLVFEAVPFLVNQHMNNPIGRQDGYRCFLSHARPATNLTDQ